MTRRLWFVLFTVFTGMVLMASSWAFRGRPPLRCSIPSSHFPLTLRVRVGDTVTWKFNAHPVHF